MEGQNNAYFEQQVIARYRNLSERDIVQRISDCQMVSDRLESDPVWQLVLKDAKDWVEKLDANWQEIEDDKQRNYARVLKFAYLHIRELPTKYKVDLENAKLVLDERRNVDTKTPKDYDLETTIE